MSHPRIEVSGISKKFKRGADSGALTASGRRSWSSSLRRIARALSGNANALAGSAEFWALKDVSFTVMDGERLGIIGRNGAGKSTLLKILSRVLYPTSGEARIHGRMSALLEVGTGFNPNLTGLQNIYLNASLHGLKKAEIDARLEDIVAFSGVQDFIHTPVKHYSSGMFTRLAFSVAAHLDPDILLLDEVLSVGDLAFQEKCLRRIEGFTEDGRTIVFVSHSLGQVAKFCNRVLWLDNGQVRFLGDTAEGIEMYQEAMRPRTVTDVSKRNDRRGSGRARIHRVRITDAEDQPVASVRTGQRIKVKLDYEMPNASASPTDTLITLVFVDEKGHRIFGTPTDALGQTFRQMPRVGTLTCTIDSLPLLPGLYSFHVGFLLERELVDRIEDAGRLTVMEGDYLGTGRLPINLFGNVVTRYSWELEENSDSPVSLTA